MTIHDPSDSARAGFVPVYALAAGLAAAVPLPLVDTYLARTARGSAMRRVAMRHGVTLSPEARRILGDAELPKDNRVRGYRLARAAVQRSVLPMVPMARIEEALSALASAVMLDSYLRRRPFPVGHRVDEADARRIRRVLDAALVHGAADVAVSLPEVTRRIGQQTVAILRGGDAERRGRIEALVDHVLDALADVPEGMLAALEIRLEQELAIPAAKELGE